MYGPAGQAMRNLEHCGFDVDCIGLEECSNTPYICLNKYFNGPIYDESFHAILKTIEKKHAERGVELYGCDREGYRFRIRPHPGFSDYAWINRAQKIENLIFTENSIYPHYEHIDSFWNDVTMFTWIVSETYS